MSIQLCITLHYVELLFYAFTHNTIQICIVQKYCHDNHLVTYASIKFHPLTEYHQNNFSFFTHHDLDESELFGLINDE